MGGVCIAHAEMRKLEGKRSLRRLRRRWEGNSKMDLEKIGSTLDSSG
jgi:hypothetical protein